MEGARREESPRPEPARGRGRRRHRWRRILLAFGLLAAVDLLLLPPAYQPSARLLSAAIDGYQATLSRAMPSMGVQCRFTPSCSHYAEAAIEHEGTLLGGALTARRILRCGPWTPAGTVDPPPGPAFEPATAPAVVPATEPGSRP